MKRPNISVPGTKGGGPSDPVLRTLKLLQQIFSEVPMPVAGTEASRNTTALIGVHLLHLIRGCGLLNGTGFHSAAITLFRPMEDALDCFGAISLVPGAAESWQAGKLKASDAAKLWTSGVNDAEVRNMSLADYRKYLRRDFNNYSHCSSAVCNWNLYFKPFQNTANQGTLELNFIPFIIDRNGHAIDAYETAHILELIDLVERAYIARRDILNELEGLKKEVEEIMRQHDKHRCQEVRLPPEIALLDK